MSNLMKMLDSMKDYSPELIDKAKDYAPKITKVAKKKLPSSRELQMKWDAKLAEELMRAMPKRVKRFEVAKMILVPTVAAVTALLFAPKSGKELRGDIKNYFSELKEDYADAVDEVKLEIHNDDLSDLISKSQTDSDHSDNSSSPKEDSSDSGSNSESSQKYSSAEEDSAAGVGDVKGTPYEPHEDQTVPADQLEEALEDVGVESVDELDNKR